MGTRPKNLSFGGPLGEACPKPVCGKRSRTNQDRLRRSQSLEASKCDALQLHRVGRASEVEQFTKLNMATSAQIVNDLLGLCPSVTASHHRHRQYLPG